MNPRMAALLLLLALPVAAIAAPAPAPDPFRLKPGAKGKVCLECHAELQDAMQLPFVHTPLKSGNCTGCHTPHASAHGKLLAAEAGALCTRCHARLLPEKPRSVHPPVGEGQCVRCHDPHAAKSRGNLKSAPAELCASCHAAIAAGAAQAKFKHAPVEKGCLTCHDAHASAKSDHLLKKEVPALCADCHRTDQPVFARQHMNYPVGKARCTSCHNPHGSDNRAILWATVHPPLLNQMCNQCHAEPSSPNALRPKKAGVELCRGCHNDLLNETFAKNRVHWPVMEGGACLSCHSPHASPQKALLRQPPRQLCGGCHADTIRRLDQAATKHPPVVEGKCSTCHSPHASNNVFLLQGRSLMELCGTCHDYRHHTNHPIGEKVADPRNRNLSVDCRSCHRSHGSAFKVYAHYDTEADLCVQCHEKQRR